ncbi:MAG: hypothetical protein Q4F05_06455 [bacterium]|nr:hypothetical protein [bacterium]
MKNNYFKNIWDYMKNISLKKLGYSILGIALISTAVSLFRLANIGTDPFSCFNLGVANVTGLSFGTAQLLVNIVLTLVLLYPGFKYFSVGTVLAMVLVGYISDFVLYILPIDGSSFNLFVRLIIVCTGILVTSTGIAMYSCAKLGISQYDAMGFILCDLTHGKLKLQYAKIIVDITLIVLGYFMGSVVGIGTIIIALGVGPVLSYLIPNVIDPLVNGKQK